MQRCKQLGIITKKSCYKNTRGMPDAPATPPLELLANASKRQFDNILGQWVRDLHTFADARV